MCFRVDSHKSTLVRSRTDTFLLECAMCRNVLSVLSRFHFLWDHCAHCGIFENGVLLMYTLKGVSSVANIITAYEEFQ